jgi:putative transposase
VKALQTRGLSQREACAIVKARRRSSREQPTAKDQTDAFWAARLTEVAQRHPEDGCKQLYESYNRESGHADEYMNYKRFRRLYRLANLQFGKRRRRGRAKITRGRPLRRATKPYEGWTLDFMHDRLFNGRAFRALNVEDEFSRKALATRMSFTFPSRTVVSVLDELAHEYGYPKYLRIDNGTELTSKLMQRWSEEHDVELLFIQPGKPTQNAYIESFNSRVRAQLLNSRWFRTLAEVQAAADVWLERYNTMHSHSALEYHTPEEFIALYEMYFTPQKSLAA